jgi:predicted metal-dependent hydrolase
MLNRWLMKVAEREFANRLQQLANTYGFRYDRVQIRRQRTRWGSCSSRGTISLNVCAMSLRPEVLRYLLIHELCHTQHMNHSSRFWKLVATCEPNYRELDRELTAAWRFVPPWVFVS